MRWPLAPSRSRARASTSRTFATVAETAESSSNAAPVVSRDDSRERRLAAAGRPVEDRARRRGPPRSRAGAPARPDDVLLADEVVERRRPQPLRERRQLVEPRPAASVKRSPTPEVCSAGVAAQRLRPGSRGELRAPRRAWSTPAHDELVERLAPAAGRARGSTSRPGRAPSRSAPRAGRRTSPAIDIAAPLLETARGRAAAEAARGRRSTSATSSTCPTRTRLRRALLSFGVDVRAGPCERRRRARARRRGPAARLGFTAWKPEREAR